MQDTDKLEKTRYKKFKNLFSIIIVGAIGSGVWEFFLKDVFFRLGNFFVNTVGLIHNGYVDSLYKNVGKSHSFLEIVPALIIILIIIFLPAFGILRIRRYFQNQKPDNDTAFSKFYTFIFQTKKRAYALILALTIPISIMYTDLLLKELSTLMANNYIERTLEIVKPYIAEQEFNLLRSKFRLIDNKEKLIVVISSINKIAKKNALDLPKCKLYGINGH